MHLDIARMYVTFSIGVFAAAAAANDADYLQRLAGLVNQYRVSHGHTALAVDATIASLAREHSVAMSKSGQLSHDGFPSRERRSGPPMCIENVGWNYRSPRINSMVGACRLITTATCSIRTSIAWALVPLRAT